MKREINLPSKSLIPECWGYKGEVEHSRLIITLPDDIAACDYCQAEIAIKGKRYLTDRLEIADSKVSFELTAAMMKESGAISAQAIGYVVDEAGNIGEIGKTPIYRGTIKPSVSGEISETPEEAEFWQTCWAGLQALTKSKHAHNNKVVLDKLHCLRDEMEYGSIIVGNPHMGLTYNGSAVRFVGEGKVITGVSEVDKADKKYIRLKLSSDTSGLDLLGVPEFIDIPISSLTEVTESIGGITTNGSEVELDIPQAQESTIQIVNELPTTAEIGDVVCLSRTDYTGEESCEVGFYYYDSTKWNEVRPKDELPTVTEADNGKVLRVVDGVWAAATISNAEGVGF